MSDTSKKTVIENGTEFDGSISSSGAIEVSGTLKGELLAPELVVTSSGRIEGQVKVDRLVSKGEVSGEIEAETVELSGRVSNQTVIEADKLEVRLEQRDGGIRATFGTCELRVGEKRARGNDKKKEKLEQQESNKQQQEQYEGEPVL